MRKPQKKSVPADKVLFFTSPYCGPCIEAKEAIAKDPELAAQIHVVNVDTKAGDSLAVERAIEATPTFVRPDGKRTEGFSSVAQLKRFLRSR